MLWHERWGCSTNSAYFKASIRKEEGWVWWFMLEWMVGQVVCFLGWLPSIPTNRVDEDGDPWEDWQEWMWCELYNPFINWISEEKYIVTIAEVDLEDTPREWHLWDFENCETREPFLNHPWPVRDAYKNFLVIRNLERTRRSDRLKAAEQVLESLIKHG